MTGNLSDLGALLGGLGLFLLAVGMMTDGLKNAAGNSLRNILSKWTNTPLRGVLSGFLMTAIVQSSSAVTMASIGFVNAGLLTMRQALGIVYGANIGTTITGWLVAIIGFKLDIQAFALPLIGIGMILRLIKKDGRAAATGMALVGFGLFFVGIDVLKGAFESGVAALDFTKMNADGVAGIALFLLVGIIMTILTQSSSASIALTITAAATGVVTIHAAAAMVIGANVGTSSTALLAAIGTTANAKRVAVAQVMFNVATAIVALCILPILFWIIRVVSQALELDTDAGMTLALFHTIFNLLGVALALPLNSRLAQFLEGRFLSHEEKPMLPKFIDKAIAETPVLALNALVLELLSIADRVSAVARNSAHPETTSHEQMAKDIAVLRQLTDQVTKFIAQLSRDKLMPDTTRQLATLLRINQYLLGCVTNAEQVFRNYHRMDGTAPPALREQADRFEAELQSTLLRSTAVKADDALQHMQAQHDEVKAAMLAAGANGSLEVETMMQIIENLGDQLQLIQRWLKAMKQLERIRIETDSEARPITETHCDNDANLSLNE